MPDFLSAEGELGEMIRNYNWADSPLGPIDTWSQSLRTTVNLMLNCKNPVWVGWGPHNTFLYNDAYIDVLGKEKHPWALGKPAGVVWEEIWDYCGPLSDLVFSEGKGSSVSDAQLFMKRGNFLEEVYYSFSYSAVIDESGAVGGLFCPNLETTDKILNERRNQTLTELSAKALIEKTLPAACATAIATLGQNPHDIPFALIYLCDNDGHTMVIEQRVGLTQDTSLFPDSFPADDAPGLAAIVKSGTPVVLPLPEDGTYPKGMAGQPVTQAIVLPLISNNKTAGLLVCGLNPTRRLDADYNTFFEMAAGQIATAIQNATAIENERKRLEMLAEIDRAKTVFFSNISHEFRTPLTLMLGPLEELQENHSLTYDAMEKVETTHRNAIRLLRLVNTLLDFSLIESGRMKAKFVPIDIAGYTRNLAANFRSMIERAGMKLIIETEKLSNPVYADRQMWEKIVFNLLSNAFKYTLKGSITITIADEGRNLALRVSDTGSGIPEKELPRIFTRFYRILNSEGRSFEGSGIGLSMIREFVMQHGGAISVESIEGRGSTFTVLIPFGKKHLPAEQVFEGTPGDISVTELPEDMIISERLPADNDIKSTAPDDADTLLIVDDNPDMRRHLQSLLEKKYHIVTAENGAVALKKIETHNIALVLSDIMMPVMDGITLVKELKKKPDTAVLPIILLTARAGEESRIKGYETGADDYLVKPFSAKELMARIQSQIKITKTRNLLRSQFRNLFVKAPVAITILRGENLIIELANDCMLELLNKTAEELHNRPLPEALADLTSDHDIALMRQVLLTGIPYSEEERAMERFRDGKKQRIYLKFTMQPLFEEGAAASGVMILAQDITHEVQARKRIEENERKFRNLIRQAPIGIIIFRGENLVIDEVNDRYLKMLWLDRKNILGQQFPDVLAGIKGSAIERNLKEVFRTGRTHIHTELPFLLEKAGKQEVHYFSSTYQPLMEEDNIVGVIALVDDVSEAYFARKAKEQNEEDLRIILETMPHMAYRANERGELIFYNQRFYNYTGLTPEEAAGFGWQPVIHPDMLQEVYDKWMHSINTGGEFNISVPMRRASDGAYRWHLSRAVALRDENGAIVQWVGTVTDIHEQKVFSEKLEAMVNDRTERLHNSNKLLASKNLELEQSNKELESFNYVASHDLQEPLRKIRTFINLIKDRGSDANYEFYLNKIDSSAQRMAQLIQAVLAYSRLSHGARDLQPTDLDKILNEVISDYELDITEKNIAITHTTLPVLHSNPLQMNQLFSNLLGNAIKYSSDNPKITISHRLVSGFEINGHHPENLSDKYLEITFADNGIGFDEKYKQQIFKLFQRLHGKDEYSGTGIGLSICKKIVEQHHGFISADSYPGEGTTFTVLLPYQV